MSRRYREVLGWLFLASLLLLAVVWGGRLWNTIGSYMVPKTDIRLYVAAPGGGLKVQDTRIAEGEFHGQGLWKKLQDASQQSGGDALLPSDVKLLEVREEGAVLVADFSKELVKGRYLGSNEEIALVYSIVNTLAQLPGIESVRIIIEGSIVESLADHVDLTAPLVPDLSLIVQ